MIRINKDEERNLLKKYANILDDTNCENFKSTSIRVVEALKKNIFYNKALNNNKLLDKYLYFEDLLISKILKIHKKYKIKCIFKNNNEFQIFEIVNDSELVKLCQHGAREKYFSKLIMGDFNLILSFSFDLVLLLDYEDYNDDVKIVENYFIHKEISFFRNFKN